MGINRYVRSTGTALAEAGREEWRRTQTLPVILSYAVLPAELRALHAAARVTAVGVRGVYRGVRAGRAEVANLPVVTDAPQRPIHVESVVDPAATVRRYRRSSGTASA